MGYSSYGDVCVSYRQRITQFTSLWIRVGMMRWQQAMIDDSCRMSGTMQ